MDSTILIHYILPFIGALGISIILTILIRAIAIKLNIIDKPDNGRKIHKLPIPLLGGFAIYLTTLIFLVIYQDIILDGRIKASYLIAIALGGLFLMIGGYLDDKYALKPIYQIIWPLLAVISVLLSGMEISYITNPLGGVINISSPIISLIIIFFWLLGMIYTTKFLDGLDGLVSGVTVIGSIILFCVSLFWDVDQSGTSVLCLILAGSTLGFLLFNFYPARIFLGEGGSTFLGFMLGVLAIISGAKIATALLIMGIPILDVVWVIIRRLFNERHSAFLGDKKHLHFRLLDIGLNQRQVVLLLYLLTLIFGSIALFQDTIGKIVAFIVLIIVMLALASFVVIRYKKIYEKVSNN
ncbi:undecaprenyl/decaprenyl-phosphate alpha-N-acetylglucosaminyl 1-phosphate transferase [bacterium]|jgi:UDP-GlcNAc:undecaprenyl-phosphate/decaprenyl-phosphate GlcNAc-1-phosphate transferase|nr:undecaprenyl/decaprenyl-phosphate alpha-N-acetylglucosaminyl 1-phosphate transferase [bacterium]MBT4335122.1 undecaprenyl/decaprenyl-phosphate alpha-N-acetylglucosaminyl 1-phosphate transferase [bacterium]MBT4495283.1 undecaprenyl/decaprenyl-phosphate alpha-N-acetylglucosaminyl 1-phosphate transferase [bacterium]MBT4763907.1 undecaprenyl/decaprenyl-phosphate alpha-N-acetylglucosaminyl 1-phosphate transferase [bacterium]MBT5401278.1 undecaprenyl/decaprenyl-phosphate alpha-N-acetylglucosaminyl